MKETKKAQFIKLVRAGAASEEAYNEMSNLCMSRPDRINFMQWVKQTEWTTEAIVALFRYQCIYLNGEIDWSEFESYYDIFKNKIYAIFE